MIRVQSVRDVMPYPHTPTPHIPIPAFSPMEMFGVGRGVFSSSFKQRTCFLEFFDFGIWSALTSVSQSLAVLQCRTLFIYPRISLSFLTY